MGTIKQHFKHSVAAGLTVVMFSLPFAVCAAEEDALLEQLRIGDATEANRAERDLVREWSKSGSAAFDFLLKRGQDALEVKDYASAIEHLTALTDHAPSFAEGFHSRAQAYFHTQKIGPALGDLERALTLNPNHFGAIRGLAVIFETVGDKKRAFEAYEMVLGLHPHDEEAKKGVARLRDTVMGSKL
jgi:tetratricopeptide (TPR) repeat protein